jgi:hypothetical protein
MRSRLKIPGSSFCQPSALAFARRASNRKP